MENIEIDGPEGNLWVERGEVGEDLKIRNVWRK
jgi:hypothetical protein